MDRTDTKQGDLILLVDDDPEIRQLLQQFLERHGFRIATAGDAAEMDRRISAEPPALIVLDLMLPGEDGLSICRRLSTAQVPLIMLSALGEEMDRVIGLELGADDYLAKPCSPRELLARIRAVLRRREDAEPSGHSSYHFAGWSFDTHRRELVTPERIVVPLSSGEFQLLSAFVERPLRVLSRDQLLDLARGPNTEVFDRAIDVQVSRLRKKMGDHGGADLIVTVRNEGYMFSVRPRR